MASSESLNGVTSIQNENTSWWYNSDSSINGRVQSGYNANFDTIANRDSDFFWDVPLWKERTPARISKSFNSAEFDIELQSVAGAFWGSQQAKVDFRLGIVTSVQTVETDMHVTIKYLTPVEVIPGHWLFAVNQNTLEFVSGDVVATITTTTGIRANQGIPDSLFAIPTE